MRAGILKAGVHRSGRWQWKYTDGHVCTINYEANTLDLADAYLRILVLIGSNGIDCTASKLPVFADQTQQIPYFHSRSSGGFRIALVHRLLPWFIGNRQEMSLFV